MRIIPADAGSTIVWYGYSSIRWDHPRGCGEHFAPGNFLKFFGGSSPRMRGAPKEQAQTLLRERIIPADAGSTLLPRIQTHSHEDHPRGCGEHNTTEWEDPWREGSSPRMRGAPAADCVGYGFLRIIPADAGSTPGPHCPQSSAEDHPRGCGEHRLFRCMRPPRTGSSPRMRGALASGHFESSSTGIIPADAGSTRVPQPGRHRHADHPRGCGEHCMWVSMNPMRWIIPADAGSTPP